MTDDRLSHVGKYEVIERIGRGGLAEVFKVRAPKAEGEEIFALKRLLERFHERDDVIDLFTSEAEVGLMLSHPNIVQTHDVGFDEEGRLFIVMEFVAGMTIADLLENLSDDQLLAPEVSLHLVCLVLRALHFAHELKSRTGVPVNMVHRDVSPENVFISCAGEVKLGDFGIAQVSAIEDSGIGGGSLGKIPYMSPEQLLNQTLDRRSDLYTTGVVLYELLTGKHPFIEGQSGERSSKQEAQLIERIVAGKYRPLRKILPFIPKGVDAIVSKVMSVQPSQRFPDACTVERELSAFYAVGQAWAPLLAAMLRGIFPKRA